MEALILFFSLGVFWQISTRRWRRRLICPLAVGLLAYLVATSAIAVRLANQALTFSLPSDSGGRVDAIVVLGRGEELRDRRIDLARELWKANRAPRIFASGMLDARTIVQFLRESGVSEDGLSGEECSQNTEENGLYTGAILHPQNVQEILLVTDAPHLLRSFLVFRSFGFTVTPRSAPLPSGWSVRQQWYVLLREYLALIQYRFSDRFKPHTPAELERPPAAVLAKISDWNCLVQAN